MPAGTPAPERSLCPPCGEKAAQGRAYPLRQAKAAGKLYGGPDPEMCRWVDREREAGALP